MKELYKRSYRAVRKRLSSKKRYQPGSFVAKRAHVIYVIMLSGFAILALRAIHIQLFPSSSKALHRIANRQYSKQIRLSRYRGGIYDHRGEPLALSIKKPSLYINPRQFAPQANQLKKLARLLNVQAQYIKKRSLRKGYFAWLKRKIQPNLAAKVKALQIEGLYSVLEPARFYPAAASLAPLIGYVGIDDSGLLGLERQYDKSLAGPPLILSQSRDAKGKALFLSAEDASPEQTGHHLYLTIDRAIQDITTKALQKGLHHAKSKRGFAIVMDPHTGRILAVANSPSFNPNNRHSFNLKQTKNLALVNRFEPGSVMKTFVLAQAIEEAMIHETTKFDVENGRLKINSRYIHDVHTPETKHLSAEEILVHSSNVGIYKIAAKLGAKKLYDALKRFGFSRRHTSLGFPGEIQGYLSPWKSWREIRFANIAFGQGLTVTGLELAVAYSVIANGGVLVKPYLIDRIENSNHELTYTGSSARMNRVITATTAQRMRKILEKTVEDSAIRAKPVGYSAAGKTGTSQKIDEKTKSYSHDKHIASFIGFAPAKDPHVVIYVLVDEPNQAQSYGALWAAPIFAEIAEKSLSYLNVAPNPTPAKTKAEVARKHEINQSSLH